MKAIKLKGKVYTDPYWHSDAVIKAFADLNVSMLTSQAERGLTDDDMNGAEYGYTEGGEFKSMGKLWP